jgi:hypothetical protein
MRVRAVIAAPADGATLPMGMTRIAGTAWSGDAPVSGVEVSIDGGESWQTAELVAAPSPYAAAAWQLNWLPDRVGEYTLLARATDAAGNTQPLDVVWTEQGYGNNAVQRVRVSIA